ncbi:MAG: hypothetical protein JW779_08940 [Candidatus Thorarchaeota archaeon]|nr:hypothetical protein [Candidatus Thorarchaeota archaeon]
MQIILDMTTMANIATILFSAVMATFLFSLWYRQENRLYSDLPLMFGITLLTQAINNFILIIPVLGIAPASLELFRFRSLVIIGTAFPMLVVLITIWLPRLKRHHSKILGLLAVYWVTVALLGPSEAIIMMLHLPVIAVMTLGMIVTFSITWKTNRLKEVRSDYMVLSFILGFAGQVGKVPMMNMGLDVLGHLINAVATVLIALALYNPWYRREKAVLAKTEDTPMASVTI